MIDSIPRGKDTLIALVDSGELTEEQAAVIHIVTNCSGWSLHDHSDELRKFLSRGVNNPATLLDAHVSTCGLFGLAVWHEVHVQHKLVKAPYVTGMAIAWLDTIARDLGAIRHPAKDGPPKPGALMHYYNAGDNDDHVEFCLSDVTELHGTLWLAHHGGGGRADCGIGIGHSDIKWSSGRPLQAWFDLEALIDNLQVALAQADERLERDG